MNGYRYEDVFTLLDNGAAILIFLKANGDVRVMLGTRSLSIASLVMPNPGFMLQSHDKRCNRGNGNISLIDLEISEPRSFNIERLVYCSKVSISNTVEFNEALNKIKLAREEYYKHETKESERQENVNDLFKSESIAQ